MGKIVNILMIALLVVLVFGLGVYFLTMFNVNQVKDAGSVKEIHFLTEEYYQNTNTAFEKGAPSESGKIGFVVVHKNLDKDKVLQFEAYNVKTGTVVFEDSFNLRSSKNGDRGILYDSVQPMEHLLLTKDKYDIQESKLENLRVEYTIYDEQGNSIDTFDIKVSNYIGDRVYLWKGPIYETGSRYDPRFNLFWLE